MQDPRRVPLELRRKYDVRGPRYTSYPPATHFHPVAPADVFSQWAARSALSDDPGLSLYLHIPFCRSRCAFCGCHSIVPRDTEIVEHYTDAILKEMNLASGLLGAKRPVRQIALGGGTPNFLGEEQIAWNSLNNSFCDISKRSWSASFSSLPLSEPILLKKHLLF